MNVVRSLWASVEDDPRAMKRLNGWLAVVWLVAAIPICLLLSSSVPFLVFISVYAVVTGHWSTWQAARVEVRQEEDADVQEVLDVVKGQRSP